MVEGSLGEANERYEGVSGSAGVSLPNKITAQLSASGPGSEQRTGGLISGTLRLERTSISGISALLNHDNNTPATSLTTTRGLLQETVSDVAGTDNFQLSMMPANCNQVGIILIKQPHVTLRLF
jgi:hypothetical protein